MLVTYTLIAFLEVGMIKKQIRIITVTAAAILTISACSSGGTTTSGALSATDAVTSTVTSADTTTPSTTVAEGTTSTTAIETTTTETTSIGTTTPETTTSAPSQSNGKVADAFLKSAEFMAALDSYRVTNETKSNTFGMDIETTTVMDYFPKENSYKTVIDVGGMKMESYMVDNKTYTQIPGGEWMLMIIDDPEPTAEEALEEFNFEELSDLFSYEETNDGYVLKTKRTLTNEEMEKLGPAFGGVDDGQDDEELDEDVEIAYDLEIHLNKDYSNDETMMKMVMSMEGMVVESEVHAVYSNFNELESFTLPEEAKNAKELDFPMP